MPRRRDLRVPFAESGRETGLKKPEKGVFWVMKFHRWSAGDDRLLLEAVEAMGKKAAYRHVARTLGVSSDAARKRFQHLIRYGIGPKKPPKSPPRAWTAEDDALLVDAVVAAGYVRGLEEAAAKLGVFYRAARDRFDRIRTRRDALDAALCRYLDIYKGKIPSAKIEGLARAFRKPPFWVFGYYGNLRNKLGIEAAARAEVAEELHRVEAERDSLRTRLEEALASLAAAEARAEEHRKRCETLLEVLRRAKEALGQDAVGL